MWFVSENGRLAVRNIQHFQVAEKGLGDGPFMLLGWVNAEERSHDRAFGIGQFATLEAATTALREMVFEAARQENKTEGGLGG